MAERIAMLKVKGIHCEGCARNIEGVLKTIQGVKEVYVDIEHGKVSVKYDGISADHDSLKEVVRKAGSAVSEVGTVSSESGSQRPRVQNETANVILDRTATREINLKKAGAVGAAGGFIGSTISLVVMVLFPNNPFAIWADTLLGIPGQIGVIVQPLGWVFHSTLITIWGGLFGYLAGRFNLRRIYLGAVGWGFVAWLWTLAIIWAYGLLSLAVAFIELSAYLVYSLVVAAGFSYGAWGTIEAGVRS